MRKTGIFKFLIVSIGLLILLSGCKRKGTEANSIQIKGSDTEVNLVQRLSEEFMKIHPEISIAVTGGGSGTGIAALINRQTDIANSSRAMKDSEIKQAEENGVMPVAVVFALDGLALIVNKSLSVESLTLNMAGKIFRGEIKNWKDVSGPDLKITLYGRQSNSGTFVFFREHVLKGDYSKDMRMMNGNAQIVEAIKQDRAGVGYVGIGYVVDREGNVVSGIKVLKIAKSKDLPAVTPLKTENVTTGLYPISRPLYQYVSGKPKGMILKFLQFELSEQGQKIVSDEGYYPITTEYREQNKKLGIYQ
jgi:phosphate transport system substrate-binding protein